MSVGQRREVWCASVATLYPEMFPGPLACALVGKALKDGIWSLKTVDIRSFARDKHRAVDDTPAGGGAGMVMRADVLVRAIDDTRAGLPDAAPLVYLTPRGDRLDQARVRELSRGPGVALVCGRFEGIDERVFAVRPGLEISLGDFVLAGGELAAMAVLEGVVRLLPGVVGAPQSIVEESFELGLLEYPQYTRPRVFEGQAIPPVLLSGDHAAIAAWRRAEAEAITKARRPDLWVCRRGSEGARDTRPTTRPARRAPAGIGEDDSD